MLRVIVFVLSLALLPVVAHAQKRVALVVGNSAYQHAGVLANPKNDATDVAAVLKNLGLTVIEGLDLSKAGFDAKVREFAKALQGAEVGVLFYAGHGLQVAGQNYLVPVDAELTTTSALEFEMVRVDVVQRIMEGEASANILFLDACRDNPLARNLARALGTRSSSIGRGLATIESGSGTLISFSTQPGNVALDGTGRNSPFAGALVRHLSASTDDISAVLIFVRNDVMKETQRKQVPWEHSALTGRFYFNARPQAQLTAPPVVAQPSGAEIAQFCQSIASNPSLAVVQSLLEAYKGTPMAACAQARVEELKKQQVAIVAPPTEKPTPLTSVKPAVSVAPPPQLAPQPALRSELKIAAAGPFTGNLAALGAQVKSGVELAVADINAAGGILGQKVTLVLGDDRGDPREGMSVASKLADDGVTFVIGHFNSAITVPASEVYQKGGMLMITPASTNPRLTERNLWNVFRTIGRDDQQGTIAGNIIADRYAGKRVALLHDKTVYGQGLAEKVREALNAKSHKDIFLEGVNSSDRDFTALVTKLKSLNPALVYWGGMHDAGGLILRQMRSAGIRAVFMAGDGIATNDFAHIAGTAAEGALMTFQPNLQNTPANRRLVEAFRKKYGQQPEGFTHYSYAAVQIIKQAAEGVKSLDPKDVAQAMHSGKTFKTVLGDISFDKKGDVSGGYQVGGKTRGTYVLHIWRKAPDGRFSYFEE